jgi:molybdopterin synthase sulfur carrier subunit
VATVTIPTQLRSLTGGIEEISVSSSSVAEVIDDLDARFPGVGDRLLDESGTLRRFINIYVDEEDVRFLNGPKTEVGDDARVSIIPSVAGGGR